MSLMLLKPQSGGTYADVPDRIPNVASAVYDFQIRQVPTVEKGDYGNQLIVDSYVLKIASGEETEFKGRRLRTYFSIPKHSNEEGYDAEQSKRDDVKLKQLFVSCGIGEEIGGGFDTSKLAGAMHKAEVSQRVKKDKDTGRETEFAEIKMWLRADGSRM